MMRFLAALLLLASPAFAQDASMPPDMAPPRIEKPRSPTSKEVYAKRNRDRVAARQARRLAVEQKLYVKKKCGTPQQARGSWCYNHAKPEDRPAVTVELTAP